MLYDSFLFRDQRGALGGETALLLDCDARVATDFVLHLKQYRLKSRVHIEDVSAELAVLALWNGADAPAAGASAAARDRRCDWEMQRIIVGRTAVGSVARETATYDTLRLTMGIAEGPVEMVRGKAVPMECNVDLMHGSMWPSWEPDRA